MHRLPRPPFLVPSAILFALLTAPVTLCAADTGPDVRLAAAVPDIETTITESAPEVAIPFPSRDGQAQWLVNPDQPFHAASTMKVAVMIELFHQVQQGKARLDEPLLVRNEFRSLADGSPFSLDPGDDSEKEL